MTLRINRRPIPTLTTSAVWLCLVLAGSCLSQVPAAETVTAVLEQKQAWAGEPVVIVVTLYSPGPFSGTPSFDLPELPSTTFVRGGRPLVGNETIDDESWLTQRHELTVFTQLTGDVTIPSFRIRFQGKPSFTAAAEPKQGMTPVLTFQSRRPPGVESSDPVPAATEMRVEQSWTPDGDEIRLQTGDVLQRRVMLEAEGTTAMMLPPVPAQAPEQVRLYAADPEVVDRTERGQSSSSRTELMKYQFAQPGTFELPEMTIVWWDYGQEQLRRETLEGRTVSVSGTAATAANAPESPDASISWWQMAALLLIAVVAGSLSRPLRRVIIRVHRHWNSPESVAKRRVLSACRAGDAAEAYAAVLHWNRLTYSEAAAKISTASEDDRVVRAYRDECDALAARLFAGTQSADPWNGQSMQTAFLAVRRRRHRDRQARATVDLKPLNPVCVSGGAT